MSTTTDQIEKLAKEVVILKIDGDLSECKTLEDFQEVQRKYAELAKEITAR